MVLKDKDLLTELSVEEYKKWSRWMRYVFSKCEKDADGNMMIPAYHVFKWIRKGATGFEKLNDREKEDFKVEARQTLKIVSKHLLKK